MQHKRLAGQAPLTRRARRTVLTLAWVVALAGWKMSAEIGPVNMAIAPVNMGIMINPAGRGEFQIGCSSEKRLTAVQEQAISEALGFAFKRAEFDPASDDDKDNTGRASAVKPRKKTYSYHAAGSRQFSKRGWKTEGELDLGTLLTALSSAGLNNIQVMIIHPVSSGCQCTAPTDGPSLEMMMKTPEGVLMNMVDHSYRFATAEAGPHVLRFSYGISNADFVRVSATSAGVLLLLVLLTFWITRSYLKRNRDPN